MVIDHANMAQDKKRAKRAVKSLARILASMYFDEWKWYASTMWRDIWNGSDGGQAFLLAVLRKVLKTVKEDEDLEDEDGGNEYMVWEELYELMDKRKGIKEGVKSLGLV